MTNDSSRLPKQLAAILYADVVGFSRMTEQNEEATYRLVRSRLDVFAATVKAYGGEVMNYAGDAILARFYSAEDTLLCAAQAQKEFATLNEVVPEEQKIRFRIGLNLGDIIEDRGDIFGDGVNVAARLEGLGKPEGICVSGPFYDAVAGKLPFDFEYLGEQQVKNISKPIRAYHATVATDASLPPPRALADSDTDTSTSKNRINRILVPGVLGLVTVLAIVLGIAYWPQSKKEEGASQEAAGVVSALPAVVVLPFINMSKDPAQEYFSDGITDDLINELSGYKNLFVIARRSAYLYKSRSKDMQSIARELGANYVVDGSVRRIENRIRVNVQIVNASEGRNIWAQQFNKEVNDIFKVQDEIRRGIIESLEVVLTEEEGNRARRQYTNSFEAYDLFLRGQAKLVTRASTADNREAQALLEQAIQIDPAFARAYAALALSHADAFRFDWSDDPERTRQTALSLAKRAVELDAHSSQALWVLGYIYLFLFEEHDKAIEYAQRSIELAPNNDDAIIVLAVIHVFGGNPDKARTLMEDLMRRSKHYPSQVPSIIGLASLLLGDYERALSAYNESLLINPSRIQGLATKAVVLYRMGRREEAEFQVLELYSQHPGFDVKVWAARQPYKDKEVANDLMRDFVNIGAGSGG